MYIYMHIYVHVYHLEGEEKLSQGARWNKGGEGVRKGKVEDMGVNWHNICFSKKNKISILK